MFYMYLYRVSSKFMLHRILFILNGQRGITAKVNYGRLCIHDRFYGEWMVRKAKPLIFSSIVKAGAHKDYYLAKMGYQCVCMIKSCGILCV